MVFSIMEAEIYSILQITIFTLSWYHISESQYDFRKTKSVQSLATVGDPELLEVKRDAWQLSKPWYNYKKRWQQHSNIHTLQ